MMSRAAVSSFTVALRPVCAQSRIAPTRAQRIIQRSVTTSQVATDGRSAVTRLKNLLLGTSIILGATLGYLYVTDTRSGLHRWVSVPTLRTLFPDAEDAHHAGTGILKTLYSFGLHPRERGNTDGKGDLQVEVFGRLIDNPIGISAGLDKDADIPSALFALGPAVVEVGGATPLPQEGNPKPRVFRVASQNALINRYGLNSQGASHMADALRARVRHFANMMGLGYDASAEQFVLDGGAEVPPGSLTEGKLLAVQVAKNKATPDSDIDAVRRDYVSCVDKLAKYADIIVVNVSSPNTPGLRSLQKLEPLMHILSGVVDSAQAADRKQKPRVMVKVSPDEDSDEELLGICQAVWASGVDGVIVGNTTKKRNMQWLGDLNAEEQQVVLEQGGYSGPQMYERTLSLVKRYRSMLDEALYANPGKKLEQKVIFATGGITNGKQALDVLNAGASVAMVYTAMVYGGVGTPSRIKQEIRDEIRSRKASQLPVATTKRELSGKSSLET